MPATYSYATLIQNLMTALRVERSFVSHLARHAGIPKCSLPTLIASLDERDFSNEIGSKLLALLQEVAVFVEAFEPVEVRLDNAQKVYEWLKQVRTGQLKIFVIDENDQIMERTEG